MINKHLAGKHNQKLHATRKYDHRRSAEPADIHADYDAFGGYEPKQEAFAELAQSVFDAYPGAYRLKTRPSIYVKEPEFTAELDCYRSDTASKRGTQVGIQMTAVEDPAKAEEFVRNTINWVKRSGYETVRLDNSVPLDLAAELGAEMTFYGKDNLNMYFQDAFEYLEKKYGIDKPMRLPPNWLEKQGIYPKPVSQYKSIVPLKDLLAVKHPKHPDLSALSEHLTTLGVEYEIDLDNDN